MDTFPFDSWEEALADGGAFFTWAGNSGMINLLTFLGVATFVLGLVHIMRSEDRNLNHAASRLTAQDAAIPQYSETASSGYGEGGE